MSFNEYQDFYRITSIVSRLDGDYAEGKKLLYSNLEGCIVRGIRICGNDETGFHVGLIDIIRGWDLRWQNCRIQIEGVETFQEREDGCLKLQTQNSVIIFKPVDEYELIQPDMGGEVDLYLSDKNAQLIAGIYRDTNQKHHFLKSVLHLGYGAESVYVELEDKPGSSLVRYFPMGSHIQFCGMFDSRHIYSGRIRIHNCGKIPLQISFAGCPETWTIQPGEARRIRKESCDSAIE